MADEGIEPQRTTIPTGAVSVSALSYGDESDPAVLLLHGWADSAWSMDCIARPLSDRYRVVSLDLRGHGHSDRGAYNMINLIGDLRGVIETLDLDSPIIIGGSTATVRLSPASVGGALHARYLL